MARFVAAGSSSVQWNASSCPSAPSPMTGPHTVQGNSIVTGAEPFTATVSTRLS